MDQDLQGKPALVTGAASAIGRAAALLYGQPGARVMVSIGKATVPPVLREAARRVGKRAIQPATRKKALAATSS